MRTLRALGSLVVLVGLLVGVPMLLLVVADPAAVFTIDWPSALTRPDDGQALLAILSVVGWVAWLVVAASVVAELIAVATSRRIDIQIPGAGWLRPTVAALVAAVTLAPAGLASASPDMPAPPPAASVVEPEEAPVAAPSTGRTYVVKAGDELWSVAQAQLGSGERWRDILLVNPGFTADTRLAPGTEIQLPPDVVVCDGDSLWSLAERHLGDGERWQEIHELNADLIPDPDQIDIGWRLLLPSDDVLPSVPMPRPVPSVPTPRKAPSVPVPKPPPSVPTPTPVPAPSTPEPTPEPTPEAPAESIVATAEDEAGPVLGPIGGVLASTIVVGVAARRRLQLVSRAIGRRLIPLREDTGQFWTALARRAETASLPDGVTPTSVVLGWRDDDSDVLLDIEKARLVSVDDAPDLQSVVGAITTGLTCAPWSSEVEIVLVGADQPWASALDEPRLLQLGTTAEGIEQLQALCAQRRVAMGPRVLENLRADADAAPGWNPVVVLFAAPLDATQQRALRSALDLGRVGVSIVAPDLRGGTHVRFDGDTVTLRGETFTPQLIEAPARRMLVDLFAATGTTDTEPAPWWPEGEPRRLVAREAEESVLPRVDAPSLVLLDEPALRDAAGQAPRRALQQCIEYCAWLLLHPGSSPTTMARALCVAEGTRRSNLSRLRTWLGTDDEGNPFLPDAYDGRIRLDSRVSSDWHELLALVDGDVPAATDRRLRHALALVAGPPLGTAATRWPWARSLHDDMVAMIVDIAAAFADRAMRDGHLDDAQWALEQAASAAPGHDEIRIRFIRLHGLRRRADAVDAEITAFLDHVRSDNRDLQPQHAALLHAAADRSSRDESSQFGLQTNFP